MSGNLSQRIPTAGKLRNKRHLPPSKQFIPRLEELEKREMLAASVVESAAAFLSDATRFRNDVETSALSLVNAVRPSSSPASVANQWNKIENVLAADWGRMQQAFVQFEYALLGAYQQEFDALLAEWSGLLSPLTPSPSPSAPSSGAGSGHPSGGNPSSGTHPPTNGIHDPLYVTLAETPVTLAA